MRNASGQQKAASKVKMNASGKKKDRTGTQALKTKSSVSTYDIFFSLHKMCDWKVYVVIVQNNAKEMYKQVCCT